MAVVNVIFFHLDYSTSRCQSIDIDDVKRKDHLKDVAGVNYFEKICLRRNRYFADTNVLSF